VKIDVGIRALRDVYDSATCNQAHFYGPETDREPAGGWFGHWECGNPYWSSLNLVPTVLKAQLEKLSYTPKEILHNWREKGWLVLDGEAENPRFRLGHQRLRMVSVRRPAIAEVMKDDLPELACSFTLVHNDPGPQGH
jgi:hypothetical protein